MGSRRGGQKTGGLVGAWTPMNSAAIPTSQPLPEHGFTVCDLRLEQMDPRRWTRVPMRNELAVHAMSTCFATDHPLLGFFDADLFLQDLVSGGELFCSSLLVNALLYYSLGARSYYDTNANAVKNAVLREVQAELASLHDPKPVLIISALHLLGAGCAYDGQFALARDYTHQALELGRANQLYGLPTSVTTDGSTEGLDHFRSRSHIAWGSFAHWEIFTKDGAIERPPFPPGPWEIVGCPEGSTRARGESGAPNWTPFAAFCKLWRIFADLMLSSSHWGCIAPDAGLKPAELTYRRLLDWADNLPPDLRIGPEMPDYAVTLRISALSDLRTAYPLMETTLRGFLTMAIRNKVMTLDEAKAVLSAGSAQPQVQQREPASLHADFILDHELALTNTRSAKAHALASEFQDLTLFNDFTAE